MISASQLVAHLIGDYVLQSDWMANEKTKRSFAAAVHALTYALPFLFFRPSVLALVVIIVTHFAIDRWRLARFVVFAKNAIAPKSWRFTWADCSGTGPTCRRGTSATPCRSGRSPKPPGGPTGRTGSSAACSRRCCSGSCGEAPLSPRRRPRAGRPAGPTDRFGHASGWRERGGIALRVLRLRVRHRPAGARRRRSDAVPGVRGRGDAA